MGIEKEARSYIQTAGWTQERLAEAIGVHPVTLSRFLSAKAGRGTTYEKLHRFLDGNAPLSRSPEKKP